jgi:DNA-binding helix-hairpin-helix protein with protein kinase domain
MVGFVMARAQGSVEWHTLAGIQSRMSAIPEADYKFLVASGANLARAVACLHGDGIVIGDVNEKLPLVAQDATVTLVDCDSFQFEASGRLFSCEVATMQFLPPELQTVTSLRGVKREQRHDLFGLAVLIFQVLFLGRHPFAGVPVSGDMPTIEEAIKTYRFAYARPPGSRGLRPPPKTLPIEAVGDECASLFDAAFGRSERPAAAAWAAALDRLKSKLRRCSANPSHWFILAKCPLCQIEAAAQRPLFMGAALKQTEIAFVSLDDVAALFRPIEFHVAPQPPPELPRALVATMQSWDIGAAVARGIAAIAAIIIAVALASAAKQPLLFFIGIFVAAAIVFAGAENRRKEQTRRREAIWRRDNLVEAWEEAARGAHYSQLLSRLVAARDELAGLRQEHRRALIEAERSRHADQLEEHLARFRVDRGSIKGIGAGRAATLKSFGIETAADIDSDRISIMPGFGPALTQALVMFRQEMGRRFVFDPSRPVSKAKIAAIDAQFRSRQAMLIDMLRAGPSDLAAAVRRCSEECNRLRPQIEAAVQDARSGRAGSSTRP